MGFSGSYPAQHISIFPRQHRYPDIWPGDVDDVAPDRGPMRPWAGPRVDGEIAATRAWCPPTADDP